MASNPCLYFLVGAVCAVTIVCGTDDKVNIALRKPARQSDADDRYTADLAVDGNTDRDAYRGSCSNTVNGQGGAVWWSVDLLEEYVITDIMIYFCDTYCTGMEVTAHIGNTSNVFEQEECGSVAGSGIRRCPCNDATASRFFSLQSRQSMTLCEVIINGYQPNIAFSKPAEQTGVFDVNIADLAVDGNTDQSLPRGSCAHPISVNGNTNWRVDLEKMYNITRILVYFRNDCCHERNDGLTIETGSSRDVNTHQQCCLTTGTDIANCTCPGNRPARYLSIQSRQSSLGICEVIVHGYETCPVNSFGYNCGSRCHCRSSDELCNKYTGYCQSGCADGYIGANCSIECDPGYYGRSCQKRCFCRNSTELCEKVTGSCSSGCAAGYMGRDCSEPCSRNTYGSSCTKNCYCRDVTESCDKVTGQCLSGCAAGYIGSDCSVDCRPGLYGIDCARECFCANPKEFCGKVTGHCLSGCAAGFMGDDCSVDCRSGTFGPNCVSECYCRDSAACHKISGMCPYGCADGYQGTTCSTRCGPGFYGQNCVKPCVCYNSTETCEASTGWCASGCRAGYEGTDCGMECKPGSYGRRCRHSCFCKNSTELCHKETGACVVSGCRADYAGTNCGTRLPSLAKVTIDIINTTSDSVFLQFNAASSPPASSYQVVYREDLQREDKEGKRLFPRAGAHVVQGLQSGLQSESTYWLAVYPMLELVDEGNREVKGIPTAYSNVTLPAVKSTLQVIIVASSVGGFVLILILGIIICAITKRSQRRSAGSASKDPPSPIQSAPTPVLTLEQKEIIAKPVADMVIPSPVNYTSIRPAITLDKLTAITQNSRNLKETLRAEFMELQDGKPYTLDVGNKEENWKKNRFRNVIPYDYNRVLLDRGLRESDYINASYVDGYRGAEKKYIATQGPTGATIGDFWHMIWKVKAGRIVMLTALIDGGKEQSAKYWSETDPMKHGRLTITLRAARTMPTHILRTFTLKHGYQSRVVQHYQLTSWPACGLPDSPGELLDFRNIVNSADSDSTKPLVIHCSDGVGRTGAYIAIDHLIEQARTEQEVNVWAVSFFLRSQRPDMVSTLDQYVFLYETLCEAVQRGETQYSRATRYQELKDSRRSKKSFRNLFQHKHT